MDENTSDRQRSHVQFVLHPHRSLTPRGFLFFMVGIGAVSFAAGLVFIMIGAWPVTGFFGLDVALIYWAFKSNFRSGRKLETIDITPDLLTLTKVDPYGRSTSFEFNPYWLRVNLTQDAADGRNSLRFSLQGRNVRFGEFLTDEEREQLAPALTVALQEMRSAQA